MSEKRYKATRPNGTDFHGGTVDYAAALESGEVLAQLAARDAAWGAVQDAARGAAWALLTRDLITPEQFDLLYGPWAQVIDKETSHDPS